MLQITDTIRIRKFDERNLVTERYEKFQKKDGTWAWEWRAHGYHSTLEGAVRSLFCKATIDAVGDEDAVDLELLLQRFEEARHAIIRAASDYSKSNNNSKHAGGSKAKTV